MVVGLDLKPLITATPLKLQALAGKVVAVDAYNTIYQFLSDHQRPYWRAAIKQQG